MLVTGNAGELEQILPVYQEKEKGEREAITGLLFQTILNNYLFKRSVSRFPL